MRSMLLLTALLAAHARAGGAKSAATPPTLMGPRPAPPAMVRTLSLLEKGKRRNYVASASKEASLLAEYRLGPLQ